MSRSRYGLLVGVLAVSSALIAQETRLLSQAFGSAAKDEKTVLIMQTSLGEIHLELNAEKAPITVKNFLQYVDDKFFDGTVFHRVIPDFMVQGGGMTPGLKEKKTRDPIKNEATNGLKNERGTLAMARTNVVDSATAQFFINVKNNEFLNHQNTTSRGYGYCVFGKVIKGMDVVDKIVKAKTHSVGRNDDVPVEDIVIQSVRREKKKEE